MLNLAVKYVEGVFMTIGKPSVMIPTRQEPLWILHKESKITLLEIKKNIFQRKKRKEKK